MNISSQEQLEAIAFATDQESVENAIVNEGDNNDMDI